MSLSKVQMMKHLGAWLLVLCCWSISFASAALTPDRRQPAFSASLLYIYATDSIYWPELTGKLLQDKDSLLILPGVVYKVWCEVLPEGLPRISANSPAVIAHKPLPWNTMAHVELHRTLFDALNGLDRGSEPAKLWCDYTNGTASLRTEVTLRPFSIANTTCEYSAVTGLVVEGSLVNFSCTSWTGYPRPEHSCAIVSDEARVRVPALAVSVASHNTSDAVVATTFSVVATRSSQGGVIECSASQQAAYEGGGRSFKESQTLDVRPFGQISFTFASESVKQCQMTLSGDYGVTVQCQSVGGVPATGHSCWINGANGSEALTLMAKMQRMTYLTEAVFNNSWWYQAATLTCYLQQQLYYGKNFTFHVPGFKQSTKICSFSHVEDGLRARCLSGSGLPSSEHSCAIHLDNRTTVLSPAESIRQNGTNLSSYLVHKDLLLRGSNIVCSISQPGFLSEVSIHSVPRFTESQKVCHFTESSWRVTVNCEFSSGYPATHSECQLLVTNSSVVLNLRPDKERADLAKQSISNSYTVKLFGPDVSQAGGSIVCRVFQGHLFARTFTHRIVEHSKALKAAPTGQLVEQIAEIGPTTAFSGSKVSEEPELRMSNQTVITLSLVLLAALLLVLLMSLPIHAVRRHLRRNRKGAATAKSSGLASSTSSGVPITVPLVRRVHLLANDAAAVKQPLFGMRETLTRVGNSRGYRGNRRDGIPDIDQYSMFEVGYKPTDPGNKRKSVLADALIRCQMAQDRREIRFSM